MNDRAYWLYLQAYFERKRNFVLPAPPGSVNVRIAVANVLDSAAIRAFERYNDDVVSQQAGKVAHHV